MQRNDLSRRAFIATASACACAGCAPGFASESSDASESSGNVENAAERVERLAKEFRDPPREFTILPFWFWNDALDHDELARQIADFDAHGVHGFTIHPRIGLPEDSGWMSPKLLAAMRFALEEARKRKMLVLLYDEGMYPSGSSAGQVVAENKDYAARGFTRVKADSEVAKNPPDDWNYVVELANAKGEKFAIFDAPSKGVIRGLHYIGDESKRPGEFSPPAADLLNPGAVDTFIRLVYQRFYDEFEEFFKDGTVVGVFTDEPSILGRGPVRDMKVGNLAALPTINRYLGYDFKPYLLDLWENVDSESAARRKAYEKAVKLALEEIYYGKISQWCVDHGTYLCGHPESSSDVGVLRKFQIPGQDIVWRYIEPGAKAFDPKHSMMAKVASSAMIHNGARRNLNEIFGAYGHELTFDEMVWLINWCVVRGQNMFVPHAFYYSLRGPRLEERPPDVGPNSPFWNDYARFANYIARLCWLNADSTCVAPTAMLVDSDFATTWATRSLMRAQLDFNYLEFRSLAESRVDSNGVEIRDARYRTLLLPPGANPTKEALETLAPAIAAGRLVRLSEAAAKVDGARTAQNDDEALAIVRELSGVDVKIAAPGLRARHVVKDGVDFYLLANEEEESIAAPIEFAADDGSRKAERWNPWTGERAELAREKGDRVFTLELAPRQTTIFAFF